MPRDIMAAYRVGRTGNDELDDALARIENIRQSLDQAMGALEDGGRPMLLGDAEKIDHALAVLALDILA